MIIAGNLFASEIETPRNDAGYGLILQNEGACNFSALSAMESGLFLPGDVKALQFYEVRRQTMVVAGNNDAPVSIHVLNPGLDRETTL